MDPHFSADVPDPEAQALILAVQAYLRLDRQLRRAGEEALAAQPHWAESALWSHACCVAGRLQNWSAATTP